MDLIKKSGKIFLSLPVFLLISGLVFLETPALAGAKRSTIASPSSAPAPVPAAQYIAPAVSHSTLTPVPTSKPDSNLPSQVDSKNEFPSLVMNAELAVNPRFKANIDQIVHFDSLAYVITRHWDETNQVPVDVFDPLFEEDLKKGWEIYPFEGKTGIVHPDIPGFVAVNRELQLIAVILRGSRNAADWVTNLDVFKGTKKSHGLNFPGKLHHGYAVKAKQLIKSLEKKLAGVFSRISPQERKKYLVLVSGHSKGGALANLTGVELIHEILPKFMGSSFNNSKNQVQIWRLSSPRTIGDPEALSFVLNTLGEENEIHQYVLGDPASVFPGGKLMRKFLGFFFKDEVTRIFSGYEDTGYSAIQMLIPTIEANLNASPAPAPGIKGFFKKVYNIFASFHLGSTRETGSARFDPDLVDRDIEKLLRQGKNYEDYVKKARVQKKITTFVDDLSDQLNEIDNWGTPAQKKKKKKGSGQAGSGFQLQQLFGI